MSLLENSLRVIANRMMHDVGRVLELHVDTKAKRGSALVQLAGETEPVAIEVGSYELHREGSKVTLQLRDIACSMEWMDRLAGRLEPQMKVELPAAMASVLKLARIV
jgi:hypothetical protein